MVYMFRPRERSKLAFWQGIQPIISFNDSEKSSLKYGLPSCFPDAIAERRPTIDQSAQSTKINL